jgi:diguanylate cyclase (GGDEF)-like protein
VLTRLPRPQLPTIRVRWRPTLLLACIVLAGASGTVLYLAQRGGAEDLRERFRNRAALAAGFAETYTRELLQQERRVAERELAGSQVSGRDFGRVVALFGYEAAVMLDGRGRVLHVAPENPELLGVDLRAKYAHLHSAVRGVPAVSPVVPSAAEGIPVVAFAVPYGSGAGRRVFSGAFDVSTTPLGAYLRNTTALPGAHVYLLDQAGSVVASNRDDLTGASMISEADASLASALKATASGQAADREYTSQTVGGTPWRLVMSVPTAVLLEPLDGFGRYVPWLMWAGFVLAAFACGALVSNLVASRADLRAANDDLDRLARVDALTGIANRREVSERLVATVANASRHDDPLSVLMLDVDHFKRFNDEHGHDTGDAVLSFTAARLQEALRLGDHLGRWGGEEFIAVLPSTDATGAAIVAERMRATLASTPCIVGDKVLNVSASVGVATLRDESPEHLVARADGAMYVAKNSGRDTVAAA